MRFIKSKRNQTKLNVGIVCGCCVLSWAVQAQAANLTITPNFTGFTQAEQDVINASASMWESLLSVPEARTVTLNFDKEVLTDALGVTRNITMDVLGNPTGADIAVKSDISFFVDPTPFDNNEFTLSGEDGPYHFNANIAGPADGKEDFLSLVSHEIGHALGWGAGFDRFNTRLIEDLGNGSVTYFGEAPLQFAMTNDFVHPIHDFDLMGDVGFGNSERSLISALDTTALDDAFDYNNKKTLHYNGPTVALADASVTNVTLNVSEHATIQDLDIALFIEHTFINDLEIVLISPSNTEVILALREGTNTADFGRADLWTRFDEESTAFAIFDDGEEGPFPGSFLPRESLDPFNGQDIFGTWILQITDFALEDTGTFNDFALIVGVPEPSTLALLIAAAGGFMLHRRKCVAA